MLKIGSIDYIFFCLIVLFFDGRSVVIVSDNFLSVYNVVIGKEEEIFFNVFLGIIIVKEILLMFEFF